MKKSSKTKTKVAGDDLSLAQAREAIYQQMGVLLAGDDQLQTRTLQWLEAQSQGEAQTQQEAQTQGEAPGLKLVQNTD